MTDPSGSLGGIDGQVHVDQHQGEGIAMADGFRSGTTRPTAE